MIDDGVRGYEPITLSDESTVVAEFVPDPAKQKG